MHAGKEVHKLLQNLCTLKSRGTWMGGPGRWVQQVCSLERQSQSCLEPLKSFLGSGGREDIPESVWEPRA